MGARSSTTRIIIRTDTRYMYLVVRVHLLLQQSELIRVADAVIVTCIRFGFPLDAPKELLVSIEALHPTNTPPPVLRKIITATKVVSK